VTQRRSNALRRRSGIRDWLLYIVIALLIVGLAFAFAVYGADIGLSEDPPLKWMWFVGMTALVFGYAIRACRPWWRARKFWLLIALFFTAHSGLGVLVLSIVDRIPLLLCVPLPGAEYALLTAYLGRFLDADPRGGV
jgi:hypothetical protein